MDPTGSCLCRAVRFTVRGGFEHAPEACHCTMCRKHSGHVLAAVNVRWAALDLEGDDHVAWYASSPEVRRGFCRTCGSTLFWAPTREGYAHVAVSMGAFDGPTGLRLAKHTFVGEKGDYYEIEEGVEQREGF